MKKFAKFTSLLCAAAISAAAIGGGLTGCDNDPFKAASDGMNKQLNVVDDNYRTYYEIFVGSFADSNADGIGDFKGLTDNLDYLNDGDDKTDTDLGINGIWLMPISPSISYHKYDVDNYLDVDSDYGTLNDFDNLIDACDERGIRVQIDLVLNHSSAHNDWFTKAVSALGYVSSADLADGEQITAQHAIDGGASASTAKYIDYYNFAYYPNVVPGTWRKVNNMHGVSSPATDDRIYCEASFSDNMPDLNMDCELLKGEVKTIVDFWLGRGVRGFRLDAAKLVYEDGWNQENNDFWTWFNNYCYEQGAEVFADTAYDSDKKNREVFNVAEVWADEGTIVNFYETGMSSFAYSFGDNGFFAQAAKRTASASGLANKLSTYNADIKAKDSAAIASNFLSNHDNNRSAAAFSSNGERDLGMIKTAASLYILAPGNPYIYYGEEIGMLGSQNDPNKRLHMEWGKKQNAEIIKGYETDDPEGSDWTYGQPQGTVASQMNDKNSILSHYRRVIKLRNQNPELARGTIAPYIVNANGELVARDNSVETADFNARICAYTSTYNGSTLLLVHNTDNESRTVDVGNNATLNGYVCANYSNKVAMNGTQVRLPAQSVAVFKLS